MERSGNTAQALHVYISILQDTRFVILFCALVPVHVTDVDV